MATHASGQSGPTRWTTFLESTVLLVVAGLAAHQLLVRPIVGVADQGDYARVMHPVGLAHVGTTYEDTVFLWVQPRYRVIPRDTSLLVPSAELLLAGVARGLDAAFSQDGVFDLRLLGSVHLASYLAGIWLVLRAARTLSVAARAVVWAGLLLATPDVAYVAYLNSFYAEPASVILLLMFVGIALATVRAGTPSCTGIWAYFACAALFVSTKPQNYALALPLVGLPVALLVSARWRTACGAVVPLAVALLLFSGYLFVRLPDLLRHPARWNGVFYGLLIDSPSPAQDLAAFGLEPELARWTGVAAIEVDGQWLRAPILEVGGRYGFRQIATFYLRHPDRLIKVAALCAPHAFMWRDQRLGNYTRESGKPPGAQAPSYTGWSDMQRVLFPKGLAFLVAFFGLFVGIAGWELRRGLDTPTGRTALLCLTVAMMATMAFATVVTAGGIEDAITDLFMFRALFDVCLVSGIAWIATHFARLLPSKPPAPAAV